MSKINSGATSARKKSSLKKLGFLRLCFCAHFSFSLVV